jgi:type 1 glutamine amidotransferase
MLLCLVPLTTFSQKKPSGKLRILALSETGGHHVQYSAAAKIFLDSLATKKNFTIDYIHDTKSIDKNFLSQYQLFIQLDYPPYAWGDTAMQAFIEYMNDKSHGWIGFHHATLLGTFDGYPMWDWFSAFMGGIQYKNYIGTFADGEVTIEDSKHPVMRGISSPFTILKEEWYIYDKSPRPNVHVIATVNEKSYRPESTVVMGDHPVIWTNEKMAARNVYIFMGHGPWLFKNPSYRQLFTNAIDWAGRTE